MRISDFCKRMERSPAELYPARTRPAAFRTGDTAATETGRQDHMDNT